MQRAHSLATLTSIAALLIAVSCDSDRDGGAGGAGGTSSNSTAGRQNGAGGTESGNAGSGGASNGGTANGGTANGGTAGTSNGGESNGGAAGEGGASGSLGDSGAGGVDVGGAAGASDGDAGVTSAGDGEPCPNGDECAAGLVCVGYGNPLPNGESTACRRQCTEGDPPPHCTCLGGGFCEQSVGDPDAGSGIIGCADTDAGCTCGEVIVNAGCADADDATTDFQSGEFQGCLHWRDLGDGQGWIHYETFGGFHYDLQTSLGWVLRSNSGAMTLAQVADFCASFEIQGLSEWRLPTIDEARSLAGGCADTAPGGSCTLSDSSCLNESCGFGDACTSCSSTAGPYCRPDVKVCSTMHTSSLCPDCPNTPGDWVYGTINGNFFPASLAQTLFPVCVMENIPRAVPCRN